MGLLEGIIGAFDTEFDSAVIVLSARRTPVKAYGEEYGSLSVGFYNLTFSFEEKGT